MLARPAAILAGVMYASWALTLHLPRIIDPPTGFQGYRPELTSLCVCVAFWGAAWIVAGSLVKQDIALAVNLPSTIKPLKNG